MRTTLELDYWLVVADPLNPQHQGLHTLTAPYLLTPRPGPGDLIAGSGSATVTVRGTDLEIRTLTYGPRGEGGDSQFWLIASHPGRSALLGEDGLEDAFGQPILCRLLREQVTYSPREGILRLLAGRPWRYAPVQASLTSEYVVPERETFPLSVTP